jgi:hypothetical protein
MVLKPQQHSVHVQAGLCTKRIRFLLCASDHVVRYNSMFIMLSIARSVVVSAHVCSCEMLSQRSCRHPTSFESQAFIFPIQDGESLPYQVSWAEEATNSGSFVFKRVVPSLPNALSPDVCLEARMNEPATSVFR